MEAAEAIVAGRGKGEDPSVPYQQAIESNIIWSEWHWEGQPEKSTDLPLNLVGVIILGVEQSLIAWGRFYMADAA